MQNVVIHTVEEEERICVSLVNSPGEAPLQQCDLDPTNFDLVVDSLRSLKRLESHQCTSEMTGISERFADLLGTEFLSALSAILQNPPVTIRVVCDGQHANQLPWDLLELPIPLGLSPGIYLVRILSTDEHSNPPEKLGHSLGLLAADGGSISYGALHSPQSELLAIEKTFLHSRFIKPIRHPSPTKDSLRRAASHRELDIFHFMGHGDIRPGGGLILLSDGAIYAKELAGLLKEASRMAFLSACDTAGDQRSIGNVLAQSGIPVVIGMQCPISDNGSRIFSQAFYLSLSQGSTIEEAFHNARLSIQGMGRDWFAPVLMRSGISDPMPLVKKEDHNFPLMTNRFVGREAEFKKVVEQLTSDECRLVTMTGMGGIGKTTLSHRVGIDLAGHMADGAFLIECDGIGSHSDLVAATAAALTISGIGNLESELFNYLKGRTMLLVFDCFERITALSKFLNIILGQCSGIKILVTSRIVLGIPGEHEFRVPPLSHRKRKDAQSEAVELFVNTATQYSPEFVLSKTNRAIVQNLVQNLEGVPLALLLAASRLRHFSLPDLAERIQTNRLETLKRRAGPHDRHADLYRVIGDSLDLLEESDKALMRILTVFVGGFYLEDALAVAPNHGHADAISWLRDNSLLNTAIEGGRMRYRMLDTIREYLQTTTDTKDLTPFQISHAELFAGRASDLLSNTHKGKWAKIAREFANESANYRQAVDVSISLDQVSLLRTFSLTLARIWAELGRRDEFGLLAKAAQVHFSDDGEVQIELAGLEGILAARNGKKDEANACWRRRADYGRQAGNFEVYADSVLDMAETSLVIPDLIMVATLLNEYDTIPADQISLMTRASGCIIHAHLAIHNGHHDEAISRAHEAESCLKDMPLDQGYVYVQGRIAQIYRRENNLARSLELTRRTVLQSMETLHFFSAAKSLFDLCELHQQLGDSKAMAFCLFAGNRIPQEVSGNLKRDFRNKLQELQSPDLDLQLDRFNETFARTDWKDVVKRAASEEAFG